MKKIILALLPLVVVINSMACPICGCGGGNLYFGLMPNFKSSFVGIRYNSANYHTQLASDISQHSNNYYHSIELWGGYNISNKLRVMAFAPYYFNQQIDDDGTNNTNGIGDVSVMAQYNIWQSITSFQNNKALKQQLWIGGGLKIPTGKFKVNLSDSTTTLSDINAQLGTGSTDFILNTQYNFQYAKFGINVSANYKVNTQNNDTYKFGNRFTSNWIAYYQFGNRHLKISPNLGFGYENTNPNRLQGTKVPYSGSHLLTAIAGVELNIKGLGIGMNVQLPTSEDFAEGQTQLKMKAMAHLSYAF